MGKWLYVNLAIVVATIVCMFLKFNQLYEPGWLLYFLATLFWFIFFAAGYYIYHYRMNQPDVGKPGSATSPSSEGKRPEVALKKSRPKVVIKKDKNQSHDK